jgi:hypothetical protein
MILWPAPQHPEVPPIPEIPPVPEVVIHNSALSGLPPWVVLAVWLAAIAGAALVLWPIARAIGRAIEARIDRRFGGAPDIARLQERLAELEALPARFTELEERLDFAERMLTRPAAGQPLKAGDR